jgi:DNA-binding CsgD family transcriptional regulator
VTVGIADTVEYFIAGAQHYRIVLEPPSPSVIAALTQAEQDVAARAARGESAAEIAQARGTSVHTVTNQLACIYRKLGVPGRPELSWHLFCGGRDAQP